jgi:hypothetical protein
MKAVGYGDNRTALAFGRQKFSVRRTETRNWKTGKSMHLVSLDLRFITKSPNRGRCSIISVAAASWEFPGQ